MRWSDISAQTTQPNVLELNDFSNLPAVQSSPVQFSLLNLKKSVRSEWKTGRLEEQDSLTCHSQGEGSEDK